MPAILATKLGMTQLFREDGSVARVTVLEAGPCPVTAIRDLERDGYAAVQLAFGAAREKHLTKAELGHLKKADAPPLRHLVEFRIPPTPATELKLGESVTVATFEVGARVKISGSPRARASRGPSVATTSRAGPSPTAPTTSALPVHRRVGHARARGQRHPRARPDGNRRVTQRGLEVIAVDTAQNLLLVRGSVPGPRGGVVEVRSDA